jgi:NDP-sugar pyrophosphorylase family protein
MDVKAILLVGGASAGAEQFAGHPIAALDVLGRPLIERIAERMTRSGIDAVSVVCESEACQSLVERAVRRDAKLRLHELTSEGIWRACEQIFCDYAEAGAEIILVQRIGAYLEINFDDLVQFHLESKARVTPVVDASAPLDLFVISASRRNDAAFLFRHELKALRTESLPYVFNGYGNRLRNTADLRQLAREALYLESEIRPAGRQVRPGVWMGELARIERGARVVAPAYIGSRAKLRSAAVLTRGSTLEHHAEVDCGTVVEDASVLPFSYVGAGLDLSSSVVGFERVSHLRRAVEVEVPDGKLIGMLPESATRRAAGSLVALAAVLARGVLPLGSRRRSAVGQTLGGVPATTSPLAFGPEAGEKRRHDAGSDVGLGETAKQDLMLVRRYGGQ